MSTKTAQEKPGETSAHALERISELTVQVEHLKERVETYRAEREAARDAVDVERKRADEAESERKRWMGLWDKENTRHTLVYEERDDLQRTFDFQWKRMGEATARWRAEKPAERENIMPDLGDLLTWLMQQADAAKALLQDVNKSAESYFSKVKPESEWDEYDYTMIPIWRRVHAYLAESAPAASMGAVGACEPSTDRQMRSAPAADDLGIYDGRHPEPVACRNPVTGLEIKPAAAKPWTCGACGRPWEEHKEGGDHEADYYTECPRPKP